MPGVPEYYVLKGDLQLPYVAPLHTNTTEHDLESRLLSYKSMTSLHEHRRTPEIEKYSNTTQHHRWPRKSVLNFYD